MNSALQGFLPDSYFLSYKKALRIYLDAPLFQATRLKSARKGLRDLPLHSNLGVKRDRYNGFNVIGRVSQREPPSNEGESTIAGIVQRNIRELYEHRELHKQNLTSYERVAFRIAELCGTPWFVIGNAIFF